MTPKELAEKTIKDIVAKKDKQEREYKAYVVSAVDRNHKRSGKARRSI